MGRGMITGCTYKKDGWESNMDGMWEENKDTKEIQRRMKKIILFVIMS
jgi:hypothetical protein